VPSRHVPGEPGGLCFPPCPEGTKSDGAFLCYKQYPDFEANGLAHTLTNITKRIVTNTGTPVTECSPDQEKDGALCYNRCAPGYDGIGPVCWAHTTDVGAGTLPSLRGCDAGQRDDGTSCWEDWSCRTYECGRLLGAFGEDWGPKYCSDCGGCGCIKATAFDRQTCPDGMEKVDGLCYNRCPDGSSRVPGMPYLCRVNGEISYPRDAGSPLKCPAGKTEDSAGLCYDTAPDGYEKQTLGLLSQKCPAGATDMGVGCVRESSSRAGALALITEVRKMKRPPPPEPPPEEGKVVFTELAVAPKS
jgi:hypothetical protein